MSVNKHNDKGLGLRGYFIVHKSQRAKAIMTIYVGYFTGGSIQQRWVFAVMGFLALINAYTMRTCLSLAITEMVNKTAKVNSSNVDHFVCPSSNFTTASHNHSGSFNWDESLQVSRGLIRCCFDILLE